MELTPREVAWAQTMGGHRLGRDVVAHSGQPNPIAVGEPVGRVAREQREAATLRPGAALASGAGNRARPEEPDVERTCFERDRDRIVHSTAFRRLAGKTQVVVFPTDHMRTRLTHALEVAQVATSIARGVGANATLADAIALGHDCGHGPGGHASEDAFDEFIPGGFEHGPWGADVVLAGLNLCAETLDGIRNHSWSRPTPASVEGEIVSWADRIGYCAHDLEDAIRAGIISESDVPAEIAAVCGRTRREQLSTFIRAMIAATCRNGFVSMDPERAAALSALREFNYERIYTRPEAIAQSRAVIAVLRALVEHYASHPELLPPLGAAAVGAKDGPRDGTMDGTRDGPRDGTMDETRDGTMDETMDETRTVADGAAKGPAVEGPAVKGPTAERFVGRCEAGEDGGTGGDDRIVDSVLAAVTYVAGMTDRFAFDTAVALLGWDRDSLPKGV